MDFRATSSRFFGKRHGVTASVCIVGPLHEFQQVLDALAALEDGGYKFAGDPSRSRPDEAVAFGSPMGPLKGGSEDRLVGFRAGSGIYGSAPVLAANYDAAGGWDGGFEFDSEGDGFGLGILRFHLWIRLGSEAGEGRSARVPTSSFLPAIRVVCRVPSERHCAPYFSAILRGEGPLACGWNGLLTNYPYCRIYGP